MYVVGLDVGGVHIKAADTDGRTSVRSFEIWKAPDKLPAVLRDLLNRFANIDAIAVTMTAELADCFRTKAEGVDFVLQAVEESAGSTPVFVWQTGAEFVTPRVARDIPLLVAAANWHALATWVGRMVAESAAVLIDVGTTTTDIVPLLAGVPVPRGLTDRERLQSGELVYSGVRRTPLCAIAHSVPFRSGCCPLAAELFATTLDVYLTLGSIAEDPHDCGTANGKPATRVAAHDRLARAICCDRTEFTADDAETMARFLADVHAKQLREPLNRVLGGMQAECRSVLLSGSGSFLAEQVVHELPRLRTAQRISLSSTFDDQTSEVAGALAVARLAAERLSGLE